MDEKSTNVNTDATRATAIICTLIHDSSIPNKLNSMNTILDTEYSILLPNTGLLAGGGEKKH